MNEKNGVPLTIDELTQEEAEFQYDVFVENLTMKDFVRIARMGGWEFYADRKEPA